MGWARCLESLMSDTCVVFQPVDSTSVANDEDAFYGVTNTQAVGSTYTCRFSSKRDQYRLSDSGHITQTGTLVIATTSRSISPEATILLSDGTKPAILSVEYPMDEDGVHHARVELGFRQGN